MKHRAFLANLQEEKESHKLEVDGVKKVFRETVLEKQNEIEVLTTNLRELQNILADNGGGILCPASGADEDGRQRKNTLRSEWRYRKTIAKILFG